VKHIETAWSRSLSRPTAFGVDSSSYSSPPITSHHLPSPPITSHHLLNIISPPTDIRNLNEIAFKTIMVTNLSITHEVPLSTSAKKKWLKFEGKTYANKSVYRAKQDVCLAIKGCPDYPKDIKVALTHKNMSHIAEQVDEYKSNWFSRFDKVLTAWLRVKEMGDRKYYDSLWKRFTGEEVVSWAAPLAAECRAGGNVSKRPVEGSVQMRHRAQLICRLCRQQCEAR
jgi:hypothetical protein